jgi:hypothetical protein
MIFKKRQLYVLFVFALGSFSIFSCTQKRKLPAAFEVLTSERTGLDFDNHLNSSDSFNLFKYMYFYNGAGVAAGDFNNDGLIDLYFASNQGDNSLYLNKGNLQFRNVTAQCGIPLDRAWSTGVSVVDINNDGLLDIYVSRVGKYNILNSRNQFLICTGIDKNGVPHYADRAKEYGLDFSGFGTQAAFLDYDMDGDLDIFLLNHSVHENGTFRARNAFLGTFHPTTGSRLFRNDGRTFTDVTKECGINSSAIGYGAGIAVSDINLDGYPDIYIGNDFHENDYMYINQHDGTFKDELVNRIMHTSQFTMGVDVADANNDGYPEIISMDMLPYDPYILKRSLGEDAYDVFNLKISYGYNYQYTRNNLQYNRRNGNFSETGIYSGVAATDWSWAPLWMDFDNDGLKDLFISNGIPKRMNDIDYINYISDGEIQQKIRDNKINEKDQVLIDKFPRIKIPNKFFRNSGDMHFADMADAIGNEVSSYSNGAVYADLDNDGDLDIVVNNIDEDAVVYQNTSNDKQNQSYAQLKIKGPEKNVNAIGSKVILFTKDGIRTYEKFGVHGFLSSMEMPIHIGLDSTRTDSAFFVWPDNSFQPLLLNKKQMRVEYQKGLPLFNYHSITSYKKNISYPVADITKEVDLAYVHTENAFAEFDKEPLIPHMVSTEGPGVAVADINKDGLEDVFIGSSKGYKSGVFLQQRSGKFIRMPEAALDMDSSYEDVDACWVDLNNDSNIDLVVASGGNEYNGHDQHMMPRVYLNDGNANLVKKEDAFDGIYLTSSCVAASDINGDGYADLFVGGRVVPGEYGQQPASYLMMNDGTGKFRDVTLSLAPELSHAGFVTKALWVDIDNDKDKDLIICSEWGTIDAYINNSGKFVKKVLFDKKGWWNFILPCDVNGDGNIDLVAGNLGLNSRLHATEKQPVRLYYNDFDDNGKKEQVLTYYLANKEIPFPNKAEMERQMPVMRKRFLYAKDFARATLNDILTPEKIESAEVLSADYFDNCILINKGNLKFEAVKMPWEAQLTAYRDAVVVNANNDSLPDIFLVGNYYANNIEIGRYDADFGSLLINTGTGFKYETLNGLVIKGQSRAVRKMTIKNKEAYLVARNNDTAMVIQFRPEKVR